MMIIQLWHWKDRDAWFNIFGPDSKYTYTSANLEQHQWSYTGLKPVWEENWALRFSEQQKNIKDGFESLDLNGSLICGVGDQTLEAQNPL